MESSIWIILAVLFVLIILGVLSMAIALKSKKRRPIDYYSFFIIGVIWALFGALFESYAFLVMGLIFAIIGLVNKNKWKKNRRTWAKMDEQERKLFILTMIILTLLVIAGFVIFILFSKGIIS